MKTCLGCNESKPFHAYSPRAGVADGFQARCKACYAAAAKERYRENPESRARKQAKTHQWHRENPERVRASRERWSAKNAEREQLMRLGRNAVAYAIRRGLMVRPDRCEECGEAARIDAAHRNYSSLLDVRWLCKPCHVRWDRRDPKTVIGDGLRRARLDYERTGVTAG